MITVKMKSTSIMETGRQKVEEINWNPIKKKVGQSVIRFRMQNCSRLFCAGVYVFVEGGSLTPIQDGQVILLCPIKNNEIGDDKDYPS